MTEHLTSSFMTKFEYAHIIKVRAEELKRGEEPHPAVRETLGDCIDVIEIAMRELSMRVLDKQIVRQLPNGEVDIWNVRDMNIRDY